MPFPTAGGERVVSTKKPASAITGETVEAGLPSEGTSFSGAAPSLSSGISAHASVGDRHPTIANGRIPLLLVLLSPAHRPIQTTRDLPGFWRGSWKDVVKDMRGRYPRHLWPDDPAHATATARAKPRGT